MASPDPIRASIHIEAEPERVFPFFTDPERMVRWMGDYAVLDARPGGEFTVDIHGVPVRGRYVELDPPKRLVVTWGHAGSDVLPPGASTVEVLFEAVGGGTEVVVVHSGLPDEGVPGHARGWDRFLGRLAVAASGGDPGPDPGPPHAR
jgi:uncharacterized protein YndB with AHSA1/START domain